MTTVSSSNPGPKSAAAVPAGEASSRALREVVTSPGFLLGGGLLLAAFGLLFKDWFVRQHEYSLKFVQDWGHAYVIPLLSGWLLYQRRSVLLAARARVFWPGTLAIVLGVVCYFFFIVGVGNHMFQGASIILTLFGVVLTLLGPEVMRAAFMPIAYLSFAITIAEKVMLYITFPLQLIAAQGAWILLSLIGKVMGFTVDVHGSSLTVVDANGAPHALDVAQACSGMRMVIAFVALAGAVALISCSRWWQRIAVVLLAVPVAVLMNILRVAVLGLLSTTVDKNLASGDAHMIIGTLLLVPGLGLFLLVVWALNKVVDEDGRPPASEGPQRVFPVKISALGRPAFLVTLGILVVGTVGLQRAVAQYRFHLKKLPVYAPDHRLLTDLPTTLGPWRRIGVDEKASAEIEETLGTKNHVTRLYARPGADGEGPRSIQLHAAYYTGMVDTVPHVPERCFVGGGMSLVKAWGEVPVPLSQKDWEIDPDVPEEVRGLVHTAPVRNSMGAVISRVRLPRLAGGIRLMVSEFQDAQGNRTMSGYFFIANGGHVASAQDVRLLSFKLTDSYAYYMKVQFNSVTAKTGEELAAEAGSLLDEILPELMRCVPDWVEVENGDYPPDNPKRAGAGATN